MKSSVFEGKLPTGLCDVQKSLKLNFFFGKTLGGSHRGEKVLKKRSKKPSFFEKKALRDGESQRKRLSETVECKEKRPQRRWKSKKKAFRDGGKQRKKPSETVEVKEKSLQRRWKAEKKAFRDGGKQRKRLSEGLWVAWESNERAQKVKN